MSNEEESVELSENMVWALREAYFVRKAIDWWPESSAPASTLAALEKRGLLHYRPASIELLEPDVREVTLRSGEVRKVTVGKTRARKIKRPATVQLTPKGIEAVQALGPGRWRALKQPSQKKIKAAFRALEGSMTERREMLARAATRKRAQAMDMYREGRHELGCSLEDEADLLLAHAYS